MWGKDGEEALDAFPKGLWRSVVGKGPCLCVESWLGANRAFPCGGAHALDSTM